MRASGWQPPPDRPHALEPPRGPLPEPAGRFPPPRRIGTALGTLGPWLLVAAAVLGVAAVALSLVLLTGDGSSARPSTPVTNRQILSGPSATAQIQAVPTAGGLYVGGLGRNAVSVRPGNVNLRHTPGYLDKPGGDVLTIIPRGAVVEIVGGPQPADGLVWWEVRWGSQQGWMAEVSAGGLVLLAPVPPSPRPGSPTP